MFTRPPKTNRNVLAGAAALVTAMGVAQLCQAANVQQLLGAMFLVSAVFMAWAAWRALALIVWAAFATFTVNCLARAMLGQFIPGLVWQQRVILACSWSLLAWGAHQRAGQAWRQAHGRQP